MYITQLIPGQELQCWPKLGLALETEYFPGPKETYYVAPPKSGQASPWALTTFGAQVILNDTEAKTLTLQVCQLASGRGTPNSLVGKQATLHYSYFQRIRVISEISYEPKPVSLRRPNNRDALGQNAYKPFRKLREVYLIW